MKKIVTTVNKQERKSMKHYFIISFDAATNSWEWDTEQESILFTEGTCVDEETGQWFPTAHIGGGEYIDNEDELSEQMSRHLRIMNEERN
jgi:hypothetical protein